MTVSVRLVICVAQVSLKTACKTLSRDNQLVSLTEMDEHRCRTHVHVDQIPERFNIFVPKCILLHLGCYLYSEDMRHASAFLETVHTLLQ